MAKATLIEKISINRYAWTDYLFMLGLSPIFIKDKDFRDDFFSANAFRERIKDYEALLDGLEKGFDETLVRCYVGDVDGRIQARHAVKRGLMTVEQYKHTKDVVRDRMKAGYGYSF